ncbi:monooxygenase [Thermoflexibacter ruber]|uniref:Copper type II ascorbate-dependent monooxygenase, C-terminal domain n=1 Tax=Thermoflexibacter ruber TaxID=1003 RepID=A0A1I2IH40_9BACT|nr:hypothetical protein [Thermoflexibacter ruber]SFF41649.1 Copper type II ascorbate-dependent monooxygenase, C-terminal domain [Thermoflexibacter ruber]
MKIKLLHITLLIVSAAMLLGVHACKLNLREQKMDSFQIIQSQIFDKGCATSGCHASKNDGSFRQHGLVLEKSVAFTNLVNALPTNTDAKADGLLRVKPFKSDQSFLFHKLQQNPSEHHSKKNYGSPMPLGSRPLTNGQIEFIRRWIEAGAPEKGSVVDEKVLEDSSVTYAKFEALAPPPVGQGLQMSLPLFEVAPNFERELFMYRKVGNSLPLLVNKVEIKMRTGSHHFILYGFNENTPASLIPQFDVIRDLRYPNGNLNINTVVSMGYHIFWAGAQTPYHNYTFPEGTALEIPANFAFDMNSHYVNKTSAPIPGEVSINLYTVPASTVKHKVKVINWGNNSINLPPNQRTTITRTFRVNKRTRIVALTSHMHKLGEKFVIKIAGGARNGEIVYTSTDWEHPDIINYPTPIVLNVGEGLTSEITYNNTTSRIVSFGLTSEDEMGIIFGYYYED